MESMKQVTRYQCQYCKKDFRTPDKHYCKFNPKLKNCFTCKNLKGWEEGEIEEIHTHWGGVDSRKMPNTPDCAKGCDGWDIEQIKGDSYDMQCSQWEEGEYDWTEEGEVVW